MRYLLLFTLLFFLVVSGSGQEARVYRGVVVDSLRGPLGNATVRVIFHRDSLTTVTGKDGGFGFLRLPGSSGAGELIVSVSLVGYRSVRLPMYWNNGRYLPDTILISREYRSLDTVVVTSVVPIVLKGDTIEYRAGAYAMQPGDVVEDLVKRFPGVEVDMKGQITAQGKKIARITVNGKEFFGDDILLATRNLPADIIKNIQVIQDYGEESRFTGIKSGQPVTILNINTKDDKKRGMFGQATAGMGTEGRYLGNVFGNKFDNDLRVAVNGSANNINAGGGAGINNQQMFGGQYGDRWNDWIAGNGNYQFSHNAENVTTRTAQEGVFPNGRTVNNSGSQNDNHGTTHSLNFGLELTPDKSDIISWHVRGAATNSFVQSNTIFSIQQTDSAHQKLTTGNSATNGAGKNINWGSDLTWVHRFNKAGRLLTFSGTLMEIKSDQDNDIRNNSGMAIDGGPVLYTPFQQHAASENHIGTAGTKLIYAEPVGNLGKLLVEYSYKRNLNHSIISVYNRDSASGVYTLIDSLSDQNQFLQTTHQLGIGLDGNNGKWDYNLHFYVQPAKLTSNSDAKNSGTSYTTLVFIPAVNLIYRWNKTTNLSLNYSPSSNMPDFIQLRPTVDLSNPQYPVVGNPGLKPSYSHNLALAINKATLTGTLFSVNIGMTEAQNGIVTNVIDNPQAGSGGVVIQETRYMNANGLYSLNSNYDYTRSFLNRKISAGILGGVVYSNSISYVNNIRLVNTIWQWNQGGRFSLNLPGLLEFIFYANYSVNQMIYPSITAGNTSISSLSMGANGRNFFMRRWVFVYEVNHTFNNGFSGSVNNSPTMINLSLERWIGASRMISVKLQCYNLLDQNNMIGRVVSGNLVTDNQVNRVGRYYMLTANFRLSKFSRPSGK